MAKREFDFSAEDMRLLLGSEQAEDGDEARLCEFFFTPIVYKEITDSTRLKVLVAHKGVGKSTIVRRLTDRGHRFAADAPASGAGIDRGGNHTSATVCGHMGTGGSGETMP